jgi:hypothetical protein
MKRKINLSTTEFRDGMIKIEDIEDGVILKVVRVSMNMIAMKSGFFDKLIRDNPYENIFTISIERSKLHLLEKVIDYFQAIRFSSQELFSDLDENSKSIVYEFGFLFDVPDIVEVIPLASKGEFLRWKKFIGEREEKIGVDVAERFYKKVWREFFYDLADIVENENEFISLPVQAVKVIMENMSEVNSIFAAMIIWIIQGRSLELVEHTLSEREIYLKELLPLVPDFTGLSSFLTVVFSQVCEELKNPDIITLAKEKSLIALEACARKLSIDYSPKTLIDFFIYKNKFIELPVQSVKDILVVKNPTFVTCENTIFTIMMVWINQDAKEANSPAKRERESHLKVLFPLVNLSLITPHFLTSVVGNVIEEIYDLKIKKFMTKRYVKALQTKILEKNSVEVPIERVVCNFLQVSEWNEEEIHSQPFILHGYVFHFIIEVKKDTPSYLVGYLQSSCPAIINTKYYLPVKVTFELKLKNGETKELHVEKFLFTESDQKICARMNHPTDNWEKVKKGESDIVIDDSISVIVSMAFI